VLLLAAFAAPSWRSLPLSSLFALPSRGEGFGNRLLEALGLRQARAAGNRDGSVDPSLMGPSAAGGSAFAPGPPLRACWRLWRGALVPARGSFRCQFAERLLRRLPGRLQSLLARLPVLGWKLRPCVAIAGPLTLTLAQETPGPNCAALDQGPGPPRPHDAGQLARERPPTLVHRRLAIQDSHPPAQADGSACGRYVLVFKPRSTTRRELRPNLEARATAFPLRRRHRVAAAAAHSAMAAPPLGRLRGMYAYCLWDRQGRRALPGPRSLRHPKSTLYIWQGPGAELLVRFGLRALLTTGRVPRRLDPRGLRAIPAQAACLRRTLVKGVVRPAAGRHRDLAGGRWQHAAPLAAELAPEAAASLPESGGYNPASSEASVQAPPARRCCRWGLFLSGGLDSAAVLRFVSRPLTTDHESASR